MTFREKLKAQAKPGGDLFPNLKWYHKLYNQIVVWFVCLEFRRSDNATD